MLASGKLTLALALGVAEEHLLDDAASAVGDEVSEIDDVLGIWAWGGLQGFADSC